MFKQTLIASLIGLSALSTGCATITRGSTDTLTVESDPPGANVRLSNGMTGKTPGTFVVPRFVRGFVVNVDKEGYEPVEVTLNSKVAGSGAAGIAGNVLLGGVIGLAVDSATGAAYDISPNPIKVTLVKLPEPRLVQTQPIIRNDEEIQ